MAKAASNYVYTGVFTLKDHKELHRKGLSVVWVEKSFYGKAKTEQGRVLGGCLVVVLFSEILGVRELGISLELFWGFFLPSQYNRKGPEKCKDVEYSHQDFEKY